MPVSASGERLARSSSAMRTSSSQSRSSGAKVTRPSVERVGRVERAADRVARTRASGAGSSQKRAARRVQAVHHRIGAEVRARRARSSAARRRARLRRACSCGRRRAPARAACRRSTSPARSARRASASVTSRRASVRRSMPIVSRTNQWSAMRGRAPRPRRARARRRPRSSGSSVPSVELVGAQQQDRVVELARHRERPPRRARGVDRRRLDGCRRRAGARTVIVACARCAVERARRRAGSGSPRRRSCARAASASTPRVPAGGRPVAASACARCADRRGELPAVSRVRRSAAIP